ncbi:MNIO family bufferin maturase [Sneathiella glossodoripedis]|uniref:MNIO family bufferin maturase n=1 Tax=Sneathiella glossodoripedis TaxID=418853 RepID=UPI000B33CCF0|nr:DUF692 domain-containing protein [Sneathiella glossodoripedis]
MCGRPLQLGTMTSARTVQSSLPHGIGVGLKREYLAELHSHPDQISFLEIHAENFMESGPQLEMLKEISKVWPISVHGVALSLGGNDPLNSDHLNKLKYLLDSIHAASFSEHIAWSNHDGIYFNDLLPIPYNDCSLHNLANRIDQVQQFLGRSILIENPASYIRFRSDTRYEADFIAELVNLTSCGLLLDVNNLYVSAKNHGWNTNEWLSQIPCNAIGEIHLAGHEMAKDNNGYSYLLDTHGVEVTRDVWLLYCDLLLKTGPCPTLIERDNNIPPLDTVLKEVTFAQILLDAAKDIS